MKNISVSVHDIVDYALRFGDLDNRIFNQATTEEGTRTHKIIQNTQDEHYHSEFQLETLYIFKDYAFDIIGRADGVIIDDEGNVTIDEIKSTIINLETFAMQNKEWHEGQAKMYAWMYLRTFNKDKIVVRMTYVKQHKVNEQFVYENTYTLDELNLFAKNTIGIFYDNLKMFDSHIMERNESVRFLDFPYDEYRCGQQDLISFANRISLTNEIGYVQAPTGIGKTISVLYPYIKNLCIEDNLSIEHIYYLTSKTSIRRQALKTIDLLEKKGANLICVAISSKESICMNEPGLKKHCNPLECPFAVGYYSKIREILINSLKEKRIYDIEDFKKIADEYSVCPFQLELDFAKYADVIICDYNYLYDDSIASLDITETIGPLPYYVLVDEAHNLPSRARDMYSRTISTYEINNVLYEMKTKKIKSKKIIGYLELIKQYLLNTYDKESERNISKIEKIDDSFISLLTLTLDSINNYEKRSEVSLIDDLAKFKSNIKQILNLPLNGDDNYVYYLEYVHKDEELNVILNIKCLDAKDKIIALNKRTRSSLFFSATLSPLSYYIDLLGGKDSPKENTLVLDSPFLKEQSLVLLDTSISTKYNERNETLNDLFKHLYAIVNAKVGNYFFYFPSYNYLEKVYTMFERYSSFKLIKQNKNLSPEEKNSFIEQFYKDPIETTIGFVVLGGVFSEGIELSKNALQGVCIVSVGLPGLDFSNDELKEHYTKQGLDGYNYAYVYPGFNKIVQAAGRVIRDFSDKGIITLIDTRYRYKQYLDLLKPVFPNCYVVKSYEDISYLVNKFWEK